MFKAKVEAVYVGQMGRAGEGYSDKPMRSIQKPLSDNLHGDEHGSGLSYIVKKGTAYGEAAKFNHMPPGQDLFAQDLSDLDRSNAMVFKEIVNSKGY